MRRGFTLIEMLVSTVLVVMIMLMFATVFQLAASAVSKQKGMAENDQRVRTLTTIIRNDALARTFEHVIPFDESESPPGVGFRDFSRRSGYFYISENDPASDTDDILQFTVRQDPESPFVGAATLIGTTADLNQPEGDDGYFELDAGGNRTLTVNRTGMSLWAEVSYFVRNGNLYRRSLLIREAYDSNDPQPPGLDATDYSAGTGEFWRDFDYSAFYKSGIGLTLHSENSVNNVNAAVTFPISLPITRFGHSNETGQPREHVNSGEFFGRFTKQETSHADFDYPGFIGPAGNPLDPATVLTLNPSRAISEYSSSPIDRGSEILLSNVHAFDVKVWDEPLLRYLDIGHSEAGGDFNQANDQHAAAGLRYGPHVTQADNRVFDTWHHEVDVSDPFDGVSDPPPYSPAGVADERLRAIQLTIRFYDVSSRQMRQLTLHIPLVNTDA